MKVKTLRFKDTKEFVHILEDGSIGTSNIPDVLPMTATIELLKQYYQISGQKTDGVDFDNLEIVEFDFIESGEVGADIRNKLSPPLNLVEMLAEYFDTNDPQTTEIRTKLVELIKREMKQTKISVKYLSNLFKEENNG